MVRKTRLPERSGAIRKTDVRGELLTFSFRYFANDDPLSPREHPDGYAQMLMERLRDLSAWTVTEFTSNRSGSVRIHPIAWPDTSRLAGFAHLPEQLRDGPAWQFSVTANKYGRVHGLLVGSVFYVVWLDCNHQLYPAR